MSPKPHEVGDVVDGKIDLATGEMQSLTMMDGHRFMGMGFCLIGSVLMIIGGILWVWLWIKKKKQLTNWQA